DILFTASLCAGTPRPRAPNASTRSRLVPPAMAVPIEWRRHDEANPGHHRKLDAAHVLRAAVPADRTLDQDRRQRACFLRADPRWPARTGISHVQDPLHVPRRRIQMGGVA